MMMKNGLPSARAALSPEPDLSTTPGANPARMSLNPIDLTVPFAPCRSVVASRIFPPTHYPSKIFYITLSNTSKLSLHPTTCTVVLQRAIPAPTALTFTSVLFCTVLRVLYLLYMVY